MALSPGPNPPKAVEQSSADFYQRLFQAPPRRPDAVVVRRPHWWTPSFVDHALARVGYPLGAVVGRATIALRKAVGAIDLRPRVFVRVDDYPHWSVPTHQFWDFHAILAEHRVPYLLGATPFLASNPLDSRNSHGRPIEEREWTRLAEASARGEVEVALHGVTHRVRSAGSHAEFDGLGVGDIQGLIAEAWHWLVERDLSPIAFIPPFNRLPRHLWSALPAQCAIICLGPESLRDLPLLWSPAVLDGHVAVYSLAPFYGRAHQVLASLSRNHWLNAAGSILPITLHWTWERSDSYRAVSRLARQVAEFASRWSTLTTAAT